ncbi:unnamed protein product [Urochloa decumbens]|uniref:F-box domain-containing protein n=1 Tax=Urochloa decumbens TaxID=240449 RepID=A0ABC9FLI5_9POAL
MAAPPHDRALSEFPDDLMREILVRLPPDEPNRLLLAGGVCKPWLRILCDPTFRRYYMEFHRTPPVAGLLVGHWESTTFVPMTTLFAPRIIDFDDTDTLDARHGRVLLFSPRGLAVWDPVLGASWDIPSPFAGAHFDSWTATVLCADPNCAHLDCHGANFIVVAVLGDTTAGVTSGRCYSPGTGLWTDLASVDTGVLLNMKPAVLVERSLFFTTRSSMGRIVRYDFRAASVSLVHPPNFQLVLPTPSEFVLLPAATGGHLLLASMQQSTLDLWEKHVLQNESPWVRKNSIGIMSPEDGLYPGNAGPYIVGFGEGHSVVYFMANSRLFSINLSSCRVTRVLGDPDLYSAIPYTSFHVTEMVQGILAPYLIDR